MPRCIHRAAPVSTAECLEMNGTPRCGMNGTPRCGTREHGQLAQRGIGHRRLRDMAGEKAYGTQECWQSCILPRMRMTAPMSQTSTPRSSDKRKAPGRPPPSPCAPRGWHHPLPHHPPLLSLRASSAPARLRSLRSSRTASSSTAASLPSLRSAKHPAHQMPRVSGPGVRLPVHAAQYIGGEYPVYAAQCIGGAYPVYGVETQLGGSAVGVLEAWLVPARAGPAREPGGELGLVVDAGVHLLEGIHVVPARTRLKHHFRY